jgi:hypothetical protein
MDENKQRTLSNHDKKAKKMMVVIKLMKGKKNYKKKLFLL